MIPYCEALGQTKRLKTREVMVGSVGVGGQNPIRIQSMTTSDTKDVAKTVEQVMRLADAGCEIVRMTVQGMKEAEACEAIKSALIQKGYATPLVADIHFFPQAAMRVIDFVDKVRINPGNFVDRRATFKKIAYDDASYALEIEKIEEKFAPLVKKCQEQKKSLRIGANHGSLSDRILNRFGDTPQGMVESALEFARVARNMHFHDLIFSMKSSNPLVMVQAYRLLAAAMLEQGMNYPLHLGVTEAGALEDGRIKSAIGIGALLLDGLGDTIRVSLTEDPWHEIDPCQRLKSFAAHYLQKKAHPFQEKGRFIDRFERRSLDINAKVPLDARGSVGIPLKLSGQLKVQAKDATEPDFFLYMQEDKTLHSQAKSLAAQNKLISQVPIENSVPLKKLSALALEEKAKQFAPYQLGAPSRYALLIEDEAPSEWTYLLSKQPSLILLNPQRETRLHYARHLFDWLKEKSLAIPVILAFDYQVSKEDFIIHAAAECGALLVDGLGDGLALQGPYAPEFLKDVSFNILQGARMRSSKTEFISCPSCGRTLFDLQTVSEQIRDKTGHLPGVKIAVMGCIVNGPGEMADADFGYVGTKPGLIDLYVGKKCVEKDIDHKEAVGRLILLLKEHDRWVEPA
ncbi:MAG: ispG [Chlamydiales bacterium]|jgi:(E)-4-hydroxy-3-methylbut-2-enyl-diphosphate synthase|nr:ispG [Chlamydiales bacterium]